MIENYTDPQNNSTVVALNEWIWVSVVSILLILFSSLPYIIGSTVKDPEIVFSGTVYDRQDVAVHLATMHLGLRGEWKYQFLFTSEEHDGAYVKLSYIILGHVARWSGLSLQSTYHLARWIFGFLASVTLYKLFAYCFCEVFWRRMAYLLGLLGGGIGWFLVVVNSGSVQAISPIEFWLIDAYPLFGFEIFPHFAAALLFINIIIICTFSFLHKSDWWKLLPAILSGIMLQVIQPYAIVLPMIAILGAISTNWWLRRSIKWKDLVYLIILCLGQLPIFFYHLYVFNFNFFWVEFTQQNITLSPPFIFYIYGFGLFWLFAILGSWSLIQKIYPRSFIKNSINELSSQAIGLMWIIFALFFAFFPTNIQRRFMFAYTVPLAVLSVVGIKDILFPWMGKISTKLIPQRKNVIGLLLVSLTSLSMIILIFSHVILVLQKPDTIFDPIDLVDAVHWLSKNAANNEIVLSAAETGQLVASMSGLPVYVGHPIETLWYDKKLVDVNHFYNDADTEWAKQSGVTWIVFGPNEQKILESGRSFQPDLPVLYQNEDVIIYKVDP